MIYRDFASRFARALFDARKAAGLTQQDMALRLAVSQQAVAKWENGDAFPRRDMVTALTRELGPFWEGKVVLPNEKVLSLVSPRAHAFVKHLNTLSRQFSDKAVRRSRPDRQEANVGTHAAPTIESEQNLALQNALLNVHHLEQALHLQVISGQPDIPADRAQTWLRLAQDAAACIETAMAINQKAQRPAQSMPRPKG